MEITGSEKESLILIGYNSRQIDDLDAVSDQVRKGIPIDFILALEVCSFQTDLQKIRKNKKRWWQFWKNNFKRKNLR